MTQFLKANHWQTENGDAGRATQITHALTFPNGTDRGEKRRTKLEVVDVRGGDEVGDCETLIHIGYDRTYGDVFIGYGDDKNDFIIYFGKKGDEF